MHFSIKLFLLSFLKPFFLFIKKDQDLVSIGAFFNSTSANLKYFICFCNFNTELKKKKLFVIANNRRQLKILKKYGIKNCVSRRSLRGIYVLARTKYFIFSIGVGEVCPVMLVYNAVLINVSHGLYLKHKGPDNLVIPVKFDTPDYYISTGEVDSNRVKTSFEIDTSRIIQLGSPRHDAINSEFEYAKFFMEDLYNRVAELYKKNIKLILWMPTHRDVDTGFRLWKLLDSEWLSELLKQKKAHFFYKFHYFEKNRGEYDFSKHSFSKKDSLITKLDDDIDVYPIFKFFSCLITDYSSTSYDFLLANKPIIYFVPDFKEYQEKCRGFYSSYDEYAVGDIAYDEAQLRKSLKSVLDCHDNYEEKRTVLRNTVFKYHDVNNCKRLHDFIDSLD